MKNMSVEGVKINIIKKWSELDNKEVMTVLKHINNREYLKVLLLVSDVTLEKFESFPSYIQYELKKLVESLDYQVFDHKGLNHFGYLRKLGFVNGDLSDITCFQWYLSDSFLSSYLQGESDMISSYDKLLSCLVFINKKGVNHRNDVDKYTKRVQKLKNYQKDYIFRRFFFLRYSVNQLLSKNKMTGEGEGESDGFGWNGIFQDVAERNVFGNMEALMNTRFIDVLSYLIRTNIINEKIKRERELQRSKLEAQT